MTEEKKTWLGKWIMPQDFAGTTPTAPDKNDSPVEFQNRHFWFTAVFDCDDPSADWQIRITGDDYYVLYINDKRICQGPASSYLFRYTWTQIRFLPLFKSVRHALFHV